MPHLRTASLIAAGLLLAASPAGALDGHWEPPGLRSSSVALGSILRALTPAAGHAGGAYRLDLTMHLDGRSIPAVARIDGENVRYAIDVSGQTYESGTARGVRWRRDIGGIVHTIGSDLQGDALDRWPHVLTPLEAQHLRVAGETRTGTPAWVLEADHGTGLTRWIYVDEATGRITHETAREGSAIYDTEFDDWRIVDGARIPFRWTTRGFGGITGVTVDSITPTPGDAAADAVPPSAVPAGLPQSGDAVAIPAHFAADAILIDLRVNGKPGRFLLDSGSTTNDVSAAAARRFAVTQTAGEARADALDIGSIHLDGVAMRVEPSLSGLDGILGYDFFVGTIVHIDYARRMVSLIPRNAFSPPPDAAPLALPWDEGIPLASAFIGDRSISRCALDTGSTDVVLPRALWETRSTTPAALHIDEIAGAQTSTIAFLEGPLAVTAATAPGLTLGNIHFGAFHGYAERTNVGTTIDAPLDAIVGSVVLARFEWWFDATGSRGWARYVNR